LECLHTRIVHRDLKPENILIAEGTLKIGDFGLAKLVDEATRTLSFKGAGTPRYMAPEVWLMQHATPATDLYAVGVIFFEVLAGRPPFVSDNVNDLRDMHLYSAAPRVKTLNPSVPDSVDGVIRKLLSKDPGGRYQRATEVLSALRTVRGPAEPAVLEIAGRIRQYHDLEESRRLEEQRTRDAERDQQERNRYKERELVQLFDEVIEEINAQLRETSVRVGSPMSRGSVVGDRQYQFGNRKLHIHFFRPGELFENPEVPGRMEVLRKRDVVHGGYIEITENGEDREGWNLVLIRPPDSLYGEWQLIETGVSALTRRATRYEPVATEARLFADNLACHWMPAMHIYQLRDKRLERDDVVKIAGVFIH
jgi:eukaryotic-like serine/threonine-protein kinase